MFELQNSGENLRKRSEFFFNLPREYKDLILAKKKSKLSHACVHLIQQKLPTNFHHAFADFCHLRKCYWRISWLLYTGSAAACLYLSTHISHTEYCSVLSVFINVSRVFELTRLFLHSTHTFLQYFCAGPIGHRRRTERDNDVHTLICAHMSTFKFPACADLYIYICGIHTCVHVHIYIYISPSAHAYSYIPRMCTMHISVLTYYKNEHASYACLSCAYVFLSCTIPHTITKGAYIYTILA